MMGVERRKFPRLEESFSVGYEFVNKSLSRPIANPQRKGTIKNISGGGLYVVINSRLSKRKLLKLLNRELLMSLEFYLPDYNNRIKALVELRWVNERLHWWQLFPKQWSMGLKFTYIEKEDRDCIIKYVINKQVEDSLTEAR